MFRQVLSVRMASNFTAQSVIEKISQDHLECPICSERFKQPKLLECSHSFCLECLQQLRQNSPSTTRLSCPVCRKTTMLKERGIDGLKTDFETLSMIEVFETRVTQLTQQGIQLPRQEYTSECNKHRGKDLNMFCNECNKVICTTCIVSDHQSHHLLELDDAFDKYKQLATNLVENIELSVETFNSAIQDIDMFRKMLDSMFAATKDKISKKADEEKQKLMQEAEQIYKDRVKTMETARATNSKDMNKAKHKQHEVNQLIMVRRIKIEHHIEQLLQDLKEYREKTSTKVPFGLTYMDFKECQNSLGRLVLNNEKQVESATFALAPQPTSQVKKTFKPNKWTLKTEVNELEDNMVKNLMSKVCPWDVAAYSSSDIVVLDQPYSRLSIISAKSNPQCFVILQDRSMQQYLKRPSKVTVNKYDDLIFLDDETVTIFNRTYTLLHQFSLKGTTSCIAVDDNNLIAVGYPLTAEISLYKPDGSLIRRLSAPGIGDYLTTYKQRLIYTSWNDRKLLSVTYNGEKLFSVDINQYVHVGFPGGVCCDKDGSIYMCAVRVRGPSSHDIHHYSSDGKYIECVITVDNSPRGLTFTPAGDLVVGTDESVQIYQNK